MPKLVKGDTDKCCYTQGNQDYFIQKRRCVIYALVGIAGLWCITLLFRDTPAES